MNDTGDRLGPVLTEALAEAGISENRAALASGITRQTLHRRLADGNPTGAELGALAHVLGINPDVLVARAQEEAV